MKPSCPYCGKKAVVIIGVDHWVCVNCHADTLGGKTTYRQIKTFR